MPQTPEDVRARLAEFRARRGYLMPHQGAMAARQHGAKAMLVVAGPRSPNAGEIVPMSFDTALAGSGIAAASVSGRVAAAIFDQAPGKTLEAVQRSLDTGNPHIAGFEISDLTLTLLTSLEREKQVGLNIVGYLPATRVTPGFK